MSEALSSLLNTLLAGLTPFGVAGGLGGLTGLIALWLAWRARAAKAIPAAPKAAAGPGRLAGYRSSLARLAEALRYLFTSREARYRLPWALLLGERGAGKTSLGRAALNSLGEAAAPEGDGGALTGAQWLRFEQGVLIDPEGRLGAAQNEEDAKAWNALLEQIDALRPERPLDQLVLLVSARTLLASGEDALGELARDALRQLTEVGRRFEFALPVYVVVAQCDAVPGFAAFWEAQPKERRQELFGWSAPPSFQGRPPEEWVASAFEALAERLRLLLLAASARSDEIEDLDACFLHPHAFERLRTPLSAWFSRVFQALDWGQTFFCRGLYFTGALPPSSAEEPGRHLAFVRDLVRERVFGEPHLATPTRRALWSRNRLIRRVQTAGMALALAFLAGLGVSAWRLDNQVEALEAALRLIKMDMDPGQPGSCLEASQAHALLRQIARVDARPAYLAIPLSWIDSRPMHRSAAFISKEALDEILMPALACRLAEKAQALQAPPPPPVPASGDPLGAPRQRLLDYLTAVKDLEDNLARFERLSRPANRRDAQDQLEQFAALAAYAYDQPAPAELKREQGALSAALAGYSQNVLKPLPEGARERYAGHIDQMATDLRTAMDREIGAGAELLARMNQPSDGGARLAEEAQRLAWWLNWVRQSWLGSSPSRNPCEEIRRAVVPALEGLTRDRAYPRRLASLADTYGETLCYQPAMRTLAGLSAPPQGALFTLDKGALRLNSGFSAEFSGMAAAMGLRFMTLKAAPAFRCQGQAAGWNPALLAEAVGYAREYMQFAKARGLPALGAPPDQRALYDRLALSQLEAVMNDRLSQAQTAPAQESARGGVDVVSAAERRLARESADFGAASASLLEALGLYSQLGFEASARLAAQCARDHAGEALRRVHNLADNSRLYDPRLADSETFPMPGDLAATKEWLGRQAARVRTLGGYASQYTAFLKNSQGLDEHQWNQDKDMAFWDNTLAELERHLQFKEPNGQAAYLHDLFLKTLSGLTSANCRKQLAAYAPPDYGNDLFSRLRRLRLDQARWQCVDAPDAAAFESYRVLADRFNRELAGRFPFAPLTARDASLGAVKAYLADYAVQRETLEALFDPALKDRWNEARRFVTQMDGVAALLQPNLGRQPASAAIPLQAAFNLTPKAAQGSNQVVEWSLSNGAARIVYPNQGERLEWHWGQPVILRVTWADKSPWRPMPDPARDDYRVEGASALFETQGPWALLRLIQARRAAALADPINPRRLVLELKLPLQNVAGAQAGRSQARLLLGLDLLAGPGPAEPAASAGSASPTAGAALAWPAAFPQQAPAGATP